jgi:DNA-binding CsgD family transcriptional regulator
MSSTTLVETGEGFDADLRLVDSGPTPPALLEHFVDARARARGPIACVSRSVLLTNAAGARLLHDGDRHALWTWARGAIDAKDGSVHSLRLGDVQLCARCDPILAGTTVIGALIRIGDGTRRKDPRRVFGWESLRESELGIAELVAAGLTNRQIGARLFLSRHTIDFHLRQIFRKLNITSRVELTRLVVEHSHPTEVDARSGASLS